MQNYYITYRHFKYFLFFLVFQSSSFDIFLNLKIGGFSFRFVYIIILILFLIYIIESLWHKVIVIKALGFIPFLLWSLLLIIFIPNTPLIARNIGYIFWLYIHFAFILVSGYYFTNERFVYDLIKLYLISFIACSFFGFLQFALGLVGIDLLVEQWWPGNNLPRLNGFSYEPSYYSTYLLIGFSLAYYLDRKKIILFRRLSRYTVICTLLAIILSSSRMGILVAAIQIFCFELLINRKNIKQILFFVTAFVTILGTVFMIIMTNEKFSFLLNGLGLMGGTAGSSLDRLDGFITQLTIFSRNPLKGYSLGGVSQAIAFEKGLTTISQETVKLYDVSVNVFAEVLTASGLIGFIFFIRYIYCLIVKSVRSDTVKRQSDANRLIFNAFIWSLVFELFILCFNQNILRAYLWVHIAMLSGFFYFLSTNKFIKQLN